MLAAFPLRHGRLDLDDMLNKLSENAGWECLMLCVLQWNSMLALKGSLASPEFQPPSLGAFSEATIPQEPTSKAVVLRPSATTPPAV